MVRRNPPLLGRALAIVAAVLATVAVAVPAAAQAAPTVDASPSTALHDMQTIDVSGAGFEPGRAITVSQCALSAAGKVSGVCYGATAQNVTIDASGAFAIRFIVRRVINEAGASVDCATAAGRCGLSAEALATAPITFDANVPPSTPTLSVTPSTDLAAGNVVVVRGSAFSPGTHVRIRQCLTGTFGLSGCDTSTDVPFAVDSVGNFLAEFPVVAVITPPTQLGGPVDCRAGASTPCSIAAGNEQGPSEFAAAPIALRAVATNAAPPTTGPELPRTGATPVMLGPAVLLGAAGLVLLAAARWWRATQSR
jgi:hypothetical protein